MHFERIAVLLFAAMILLVHHAKGGTQNTWNCNDGSDIELDWKCDGVTDCLDGSDESLENCPPRECQFGEFQCSSGLCIPRVLVCNGEVDCGVAGNQDDSDETQNCQEFHQSQNECDRSNSHLCTNGLCIPDLWVCDGMDDCGDGTDEVHCIELCLIGSVKCNRTSRCISLEWICDGNRDCIDGEDESNCKTENIDPPKVKPSSCDVNEYTCEQKCVPLEKVCDGKRDCSDGEDEGVHCQADTCRKRSDPLSWHGVSARPSCDQGCRKTPKGPKCFCFSGYRLSPNGYTCTVEGPILSKLFFSADDEIRSLTLPLNLSESSEKIEFKDYANSNSSILAVECDGQNEALIWSESHSQKVQYMDKSQQTQVLFQALNVNSLSLDWITRNLYFTYKSHVETQLVGVVSLSGREDLREAEIYNINLSLANPMSICVHPQRGKIVIVDQGNNTNPSRLILADMDGGNSQVLATEHESLMVSVTIDYVTDIIYWSEVNDNEARLKMMKMGESTRKTLLSSSENNVRFSNPNSLAVFENTVYFSDHLSREIWAVDSLNGKPKSLANSQAPLVKAALVTQLLAVQVYHPLKQRQTGVNPCKLANCSHLCVLRPNGISCLCPISMILADEITCVDLNVTNNAAIQTQATNSPIVTTHQSNGFGLKNYSSTSHSIGMSSIGVKPNKNFTKSTVNNSVFNISIITTAPAMQTAKALTKKCASENVNLSNAHLVAAEEFARFSVGSQIVYSCNDGFHIQGDSTERNLTLTCLKNGFWNLKPLCVKYTCSSLDCGSNGGCRETLRKGTVCQCFDGSLSYSKCSSSSSATTLSNLASLKNNDYGFGKYITIGLVIIILVLTGGALLWKFFRNSKKYLSMKRQYRVSPMYRSSSNKSFDKINVDSGMSETEQNSSMTLVLPQSHASDDNDSGMDRSNSSLSSETLPCNFKYQKLKQAAAEEEIEYRVLLDDDVAANSSDIGQKDLSSEILSNIKREAGNQKNY